MPAGSQQLEGRTAVNQSAAASYQTDQVFFTRMAIAVSALTIFGFAQFAARGIPDYANAPLHIHLHGIIYLGWLILFCTQNLLAGNGNLALHRRLGKLGLPLILAMIVVGSYAGLQSITRDHVPPHYTPAYFLPLVQIAVVTFGGLAIAGLVMRHDTQWHRRLLLMATIILTDPALDRIVPGPIVGGPVSQWIIMAIQLVLAGFVLLHDRKVLGRVHQATWWGIGVIVASHVLTDALARVPAVAAIAQSMMPG
jgi:FtsH-binding integral membrane protein